MKDSSTLWAKQAELASKMRTWIATITMEDRMPHEAYQIVCDDFYRHADLINQLRTEDRKGDGIIGEWKSVESILKRGMGECSLWIDTSDCMDFFSDLHVAIFKTSVAFSI